MNSLALDIGGANLKAADGRGWARSVPFALWREPKRLTHAIEELVRSAPASARLAVTMTGELCDAFRTKDDGARHILASVAEVSGGREIAVYLVNGRIVSIDEARERPLLAAASNWHALAHFACRYFDERSGLLIDVGSTTTDIVPIANGRVAARGASDTERLLAGELAYTGVGRTPLCAVTHMLPWRGQQYPVAAEFFATTADAYVLLGEIPEQPAAAWTADGRPLTRTFACERVARMICADNSTFTESDALVAAEWVRDAQFAQLKEAARPVASGLQQPIDRFVISGSGEFLARRIIHEAWPAGRTISLTEELGPEVGACAPAHALAVLARETESQ